MKNLIVIAGLTASGKSSLLDELCHKHNFEKLVTTTTRDPRPGEVDGVDYHFLSKKDFMKKLEKGFFLEHVAIKGQFYGTGKNAFEKDFGNKKPIIILDPVGVVAFKNEFENSDWKVSSVWVDESPKTCVERVMSRDAKETERQKRLHDIQYVEHTWATHTKYDTKTTPLATIEDNVKMVNDFYDKLTAKAPVIKKEHSVKKNPTLKI